MKALISSDDILNATNLKKLNMKLMAKIIMQITKIDAINKLYSDLYEFKGIDFVNKFFEELHINIQLFEKELRNIPKTGPFIIIANHPLGAIDGLMLIQLVAAKRPDFKVMANFLLKNIEPIEDFFIPVNPFDELSSKSSIGGMKAALSHLKDGHPLGIFPAGEVSSYQTNSRKITDIEWQKPALKLIQHAKVPVIPIFFKGNNSLLFQLLGLVHPRLRTAKLASEVFKKKDSTLSVRIGAPIPLSVQESFSDLNSYGRFLRAKTYSLGSADLEVRKFYLPREKTAQKAQTIIAQPSKEAILNEIEQLRGQNKIIEQNEFEVFLIYSTDAPNILTEIGRLREITFRAVGEGTNNAIDLDEFDLHYHHLFLWDKNEQKIVGAYRLGKGNDIITKYGISGFYVNTLFKCSRQMSPILAQSIELGRSWIREEYQLKRLPLFLLWKGIMQFILENKNYRYVIGPVSISSNYSKTSQTLIVEFIKKFYYNHELAAMVKPTHPFKGKIKDEDITALLDMMSNDMKNLDRIIADIEPFQFSIPVLLKKYINQNARIIGFNVDPDFNYALDGLMILDSSDLKEESISTFSDTMSV